MGLCPQNIYEGFASWYVNLWNYVVIIFNYSLEQPLCVFTREKKVQGITLEGFSNNLFDFSAFEHYQTIPKVTSPMPLEVWSDFLNLPPAELHPWKNVAVGSYLTIGFVGVRHILASCILLSTTQVVQPPTHYLALSLSPHFTEVLNSLRGSTRESVTAKFVRDNFLK